MVQHDLVAGLALHGEAHAADQVLAEIVDNLAVGRAADQRRRAFLHHADGRGNLCDECGRGRVDQAHRLPIAGVNPG